MKDGKKIKWNEYSYDGALHMINFMVDPLNKSTYVNKVRAGSDPNTLALSIN